MTYGGNLYRHRADYVVADSNISTTSGGVARIRGRYLNTSEVNESNYGDALHRLTGNQGSGRVREDDGLIVEIKRESNSLDQITGKYLVSAMHDINDINDEDVIFSSAADETGSFLYYLTAWFTERSDVAVEVHSQAYRTPTTLVMRETYDGSGEFALKIKAVPFGTGDGPIRQARRRRDDSRDPGQAARLGHAVHRRFDGDAADRDDAAVVHRLVARAQHAHYGQSPRNLSERHRRRLRAEREEHLTSCS